MKKCIFNYRYMLIPVAIPLLNDFYNGKLVTLYRVILIFGFRVAYWTVRQ